jgi:hypothetical protein
MISPEPRQLWATIKISVKFAHNADEVAAIFNVLGGERSGQGINF